MPIGVVVNPPVYPDAFYRDPEFTFRSLWRSRAVAISYFLLA